MEMMISRKIEWDMGHRVPDHQSLCRNLHGHRYVCEAMIRGTVNDIRGDPERGMVRDFGKLKEWLDHIVSPLDHGFMIYDQDPDADLFQQFQTKLVVVPFIPTAEKIAEMIFRQLQTMADSNTRTLFTAVCQVTLWETPNCKATLTKIPQG